MNQSWNFEGANGRKTFNNGSSLEIKQKKNLFRASKILKSAALHQYASDNLPSA